jgi:2-(1,2-epoxy-1,2-dihydrophenyl)acetyl-CoA isomerase
MMMLGEDVHAEQALDWGLAHRVVPAAQLAEETRAFAARLASLPRSAGMVKRLLRKTMSLSLPEQMKLEAKMQAEAGQTADFAEGVGAFLEKRPARFSGR